MNSLFSRREIVNKENIGHFANVKKSRRDSTCAFTKEAPQFTDNTLCRMQLETDCPTTVPMVTHHINSIISYICTREDQETRINPDYMSHQRDINLRMRSILIDWLVDVHIKFKMLPQSLFMTISVIDRFLSVKEVSRQKLQLVGVTSLMIVGKYEEIYPPLLKDYIAVCDNAYTKEDILSMESEILLTLNFELNKTCSFVFLEYFRSKYSLEDRSFAFCRYLLENALLDVSYLKFNNYILAAGSIFLVNKIFKKEGWSKHLEEITGVTDSKAKSCAKELFAMMSKPEISMLTAIKRKFSDQKNFEVSKYKIEKVPSQNPAA